MWEFHNLSDALLGQFTPRSPLHISQVWYPLGFPHPIAHWQTCKHSTIHCGLVGMASSAGSSTSSLKIQLVISFFIYTQQSTKPPNAFFRKLCCPTCVASFITIWGTLGRVKTVRDHLNIDIFFSIQPWPGIWNSASKLITVNFSVTPKVCKMFRFERRQKWASLSFSLPPSLSFSPVHSLLPSIHRQPFASHWLGAKHRIWGCVYKTTWHRYVLLLRDFQSVIEGLLH